MNCIRPSASFWRACASARSCCATSSAATTRRIATTPIATAAIAAAPIAASSVRWRRIHRRISWRVE